MQLLLHTNYVHSDGLLLVSVSDRNKVSDMIVVLEMYQFSKHIRSPLFAINSSSTVHGLIIPQRLQTPIQSFLEQCVMAVKLPVSCITRMAFLKMVPVKVQA